MLNIIKNTINRVFASGVDSDASAFITATGLSGTTQKSAITTLVKDLKSSGLWSKMKAVYPMVTDNYNLLSYTEDFSNALWSKTNTTITANSTTNPFGANTATKLIENIGSGSKYVALTTTSTTVSQTYTFSVYLKAAERSWAIVGQDTLGTGYFWVNLSNGTFGSGAGTYLSRSITSAGNGWYKITVTYSAASTSANGIVFISSADGAVNYTGNGTNGIFISSPQLELGTSTISAYQPILTTPSAYMASQMKYNLKDARDLDAAFRLTWSGGWTYSATGATPNGTNAYADTKFNLLTNLPGYDNSFSVYFRQNLYGTYKVGASGSSFDRGMSAHLGWTNSSGTLYHDNLGRNTMVNSAYGTFDAYHISSVTSTSSQKLYRNGVMKLSGAATSGLTQPSINFYFGASNDNGTANYFDPKQIAFGTLSTSLTDQEAQLLNQIVEKYQVALSRGVQAAQSFYYNSAYSNEANTYLYSTQITGTTQVSAINTLINGLKANNLWTKMKAVYPFVTDIKNMLAYTENYVVGTWNKQNTTVTANSVTAPNGTLTANTLTATSTSTVFISQALPTLTNGQVYTVSRYVKAGTKNFCTIGLHALADAYFDLVNLTYSFSGTGAVSASITDVGDGWRRISATYNWTGSTYNVYFAMASSLSSQAGLTVGDFQYTWGTQLELGSSATAYQPILGANNYATNVAAQMKFNLVNPQDSDAAFRLAFSGGWTYSTNGAQPNGTNGYADTKLGQTAAGMFTNSHLSFYSRTNSTTATAQVEMGVGATVPGTFANLLMRLDTSTNYVGGSIGSRNALSTAANSIGHVIVNALSASAKAYKNGSLVATDTSTQTGTLNSLPIYIGCQNNNSVPGAYTTRQAAFASIGDGLSDAEAALLYSLVQQFQTDLTRQV
jgi:hypothetical protein